MHKFKKPCSLIVAYSLDGSIIGKDGGIPWHLPKDMKFFKKVSMEAGTCIMGRKNYESLPDGYRPLPGRKNIILTRNPTWAPKEKDKDNIFVKNNMLDAIELAQSLPGEEICFIGGADIYKWALEEVALNKIHRTIVMGSGIKGDVFFPLSSLPNLNAQYKRVFNQTTLADDKHKYGFLTETWELL